MDCTTCNRTGHDSPSRLQQLPRCRQTSLLLHALLLLLLSLVLDGTAADNINPLAGAAGSEQHAWVLSDLAAVNRSRTPWVVVGGHRPIYISSNNIMPGDGDQPVAAALREAFEDAFIKYKVILGSI
eukprot:GHRR01029908.1.p1 GENE.GHRR01029908.1~~GHRR01029908.1.p1  ORF type:complete len:127 (-),score=30.07 GHRR01029908.1:375-755(-)